MTPRKQIEVSKQTREMLVKTFKTTKVSVWRALAFRDNSPKSQRIRMAAEQNGGVLLLLTPAMETLHDADGFMRQYFPADVLVECDKNTGRVELLKRGEVVKAVGIEVKPDIESLPCIYIVGNLNNWHAPYEYEAEFYENFKLNKVNPNEFEGEFEFPAAGGMFRFLKWLSGWEEENCLGADTPQNYENFRIAVHGTDVFDIRDNWGSNWDIVNLTEPTKLKLNVNLNTYKLTIMQGNSKVDIITFDENSGLWYDLNGNRVEKPSKGIYVKVNGKKSEKVMVK